MKRPGALTALLVLGALAAPGGVALGKGPRKAKAPPASRAPVAGVTEERPAPAAPASSASAPRSRGRTAPAPVSAPASSAARQVVQRESHIEFDERLVQGQTAAGAIYLFQRGESEFRSMVRLPASFRDRTVRPLLPEARGPIAIPPQRQ